MAPRSTGGSDEEPSIGGRLLGTNGLQQATNSAQRQVQQLGGNISALNAAIRDALNEIRTGQPGTGGSGVPRSDRSAMNEARRQAAARQDAARQAQEESRRRMREENAARLAEQNRLGQQALQARLQARQQARQTSSDPAAIPAAARLGNLDNLRYRQWERQRARQLGAYSSMFDDLDAQQRAANAPQTGMVNGQGSRTTPFFQVMGQRVQWGPPPPASPGAQGPPPGAGPNGRAPIVVGNAVKSLGNRTMAYGKHMQAQAEEMDRWAQFAQLAYKGQSDPGWGLKNYIRKSTYNNVVGLSTEDITSANLTLAKSVPVSVGSKAFNRAQSQMYGLAYVDPSMGAEGAANMMADFYNPRSALVSTAFGYTPTVGEGGKMATPNQLADSIMKRTFQGKSSVKIKNFNADAANGGALRSNIQALGQQSGWSQETVDGMIEYMRGRNTAMQRGDMTSDEFDKVIQDASRTGSKGEDAREKLKKLGVGDSVIQARKNLEGSQRKHDSAMMDDFGPALETATEALGQFREAINKILELPGISDIIGTAGGWGGVWGPVLKRGMGMLNIGGGAAATSMSQARSPDDKMHTAKVGKTASGKAAAAIQAALGQVGKPYEWGADGPNSFDCSGLMQWAYAKAGIRLPRISQQQMRVGVGKDKDEIAPGDLLFPNSGHVMMAIGGGKLVEAPRTGLDVRVRKFSLGEIKAVRRVASSVGALSDHSGEEDKKQNDNSGGNSGSAILGGSDYGSVEEAEAIAAALSGLAAAATMGDNKQGTKKEKSKDNVDVAAGPKNPKGNAALGKKLASQLYGWVGKEWDALYQLWEHESGWRHTAENPSSGAYGIVQALPPSKMNSVGRDWKTNPATQIKWGLKYIKQRPDYGKPSKAWDLWQRRSPHWYDVGAWDIPEDQPAVVHKGEMIIPKGRAETIRQALIRDSVPVRSTSGAAVASATSSGGGGTGVHLSFHSGAIQVHISGAADSDSANLVGKQIVDAVMNDARLNQIAVGV